MSAIGRASLQERRNLSGCGSSIGYCALMKRTELKPALTTRRASHRQCPITLHLHLLLLDSYMLQHYHLLPFGPPPAIIITKTRQVLSHLISLPPLLRPRHLAPSCDRTFAAPPAQASGVCQEPTTNDDDADKEEVPVPPPSSFPILHSYNFFCSRVSMASC